jgi:hypothetical protein
VLPIGADRLQVSWSAPDKSQQNGRLSSYIVRWTRVKSADDEDDANESGGDVRRTNGEGGELNLLASAPTEITVTDLNTYTLYRVTVTAGTREGFGPDSEPVEQRTGEDGQCCLPDYLFSLPLLQTGVFGFVFGVFAVGCSFSVRLRA